VYKGLWTHTFAPAHRPDKSLTGHIVGIGETERDALFCTAVLWAFILKGAGVRGVLDERELGSDGCSISAWLDLLVPDDPGEADAA
jgi:hypothetical protein